MVGGSGDFFIINGNFENKSTQVDLWDTELAYLGFQGSGDHVFYNWVLDGSAQLFSWDTLEVLGGNLQLYGEELYVDNLILSAGSSLNIDGISIFYNSLTDNGGSINFLNGGQLIENPVPIPSAVWLLGSGLIGILGIRRKFKT